MKHSVQSSLVISGFVLEEFWLAIWTSVFLKSWLQHCLSLLLTTVYKVILCHKTLHILNINTKVAKIHFLIKNFSLIGGSATAHIYSMLHIMNVQLQTHKSSKDCIFTTLHCLLSLSELHPVWVIYVLCCHIQYGTLITTVLSLLPNPGHASGISGLPLWPFHLYSTKPQTNRRFFLFVWYLKALFHEEETFQKGQNNWGKKIQTVFAKLRVDCRLPKYSSMLYDGENRLTITTNTKPTFQ